MSFLDGVLEKLGSVRYRSRSAAKQPEDAALLQSSLLSPHPADGPTDQVPHQGDFEIVVP